MTDWITQLKLKELEQQNGLPSGLLGAVMNQESAGDPNAVSPKGAQGLFQFMPDTAKAYGINPYDPQQAAIGAARMYGDLSKQYDGNLPMMLAGYNWGSGNLARNGLENAPQETKDYISKITSALESTNLNPALPNGVQVADSGEFMSDAPNPMTGEPTLDEIDAEIARRSAAPASEPSLDEIDAEIARRQGQAQLPDVLSQPETPKEDQNFFERVWDDLKSRGAGAKESIDANISGQQGDAETAWQLLANFGIGSVGDVLGEGLVSAGRGLSAITPDAIEDPIKQAVARGFNTGAESLSPLLEKLSAAYDESSPRTKRNLDAAGNTFAALMPGSKGYKAAGEGLEAVAKAGPQAVKATGEAVKSGVTKTTALAAPTVAAETVPLAARAKEMGFDLRVDQVAPGRYRDNIQKTSQSIPFSGQKALEEGQEKLWNRKLAGTLGEEADALTPEVIQRFVSRNGAEFESIFKNKNIQIDDAFMKSLDDLAEDVADTTTGDISEVVLRNINKLKSNVAEGVISGEKLGSIRSNLLKKQSMAQGEIKEGLGDMISQLDDLASKSLTDDEMKRWSVARREYRNYKTIQPALKGSTDGYVNPTDLMNRVKSSKFIGADKISTGQDDLVDLARIGKEFLVKKGGSDTLPNSIAAASPFAALSAPFTTLGIIGGNRAYQALYNSSQDVVDAAIKKGQTALEKMANYGRKVEKPKGE